MPHASAVDRNRQVPSSGRDWFLQVLSRFVRHRLLVLTTAPSKENLATMRELAESGKVTPVIDRTYRLSETPEAIRYLEVEHARAKVVITV